jgi:hypothetical protein
LQYTLALRSPGLRQAHGVRLMSGDQPFRAINMLHGNCAPVRGTLCRHLIIAD